MNNLRIFLVEDNMSFALEVEMLVSRLGCSMVGQADNGAEAICKVDEKNPNLILLDIGIRGTINGLDLAKKFRQQKRAIIFITQSRDRNTYQTAQTFQPLAYLVKPFDLLTLRSTLEQASRTLPPKKVSEPEGKNDPYSFYIRQNNVLNKVKYNQISWIKSDGNYCNIHTVNKKFVTKVSLVTLMKRLEKMDFIRVHKQYIVPVYRIENINLVNSVLYIGDQMIPIGRSYKSVLVKQLDLI